jgi:hypothetical protein
MPRLHERAQPEQSPSARGTNNWTT